MVIIEFTRMMSDPRVVETQGIDSSPARVKREIHHRDHKATAGCSPSSFSVFSVSCLELKGKSQLKSAAIVADMHGDAYESGCL